MFHTFLLIVKFILQSAYLCWVESKFVKNMYYSFWLPNYIGYGYLVWLFVVKSFPMLFSSLIVYKHGQQESINLFPESINFLEYRPMVENNLKFYLHRSQNKYRSAEFKSYGTCIGNCNTNSILKFMGVYFPTKF